MTQYAWSDVWIPQTMEMALVPNTRVHASPYTRGVQVVDLLGERWRMAFELPSRKHASAAAVEAFLARLLGMRHEVLLWHFVRPVPRGTMRGAPVLSGAVAQGAQSLPITTTAGATVRAGDMLGAGGQLFMAAADATANGSGAITVATCNRARASIASGSAVTWSKPTAAFRLTSTSGVPVAYRPGAMQSLQVEFMESWA